MNFDYMTPEEEEMCEKYLDGVKPDMVNSPPHYQGDIECIDAIEAALGEHFSAYCRGTAMKYIWRTGKKWDADEDIEKAIWYLQRSIDAKW
jgi:hypothetical protein